MRIGEFAARAGVSVHTLRYYERVGLLPRAERTRAGYRQYPAEAARRVRLLRVLRGLGFGVRDLRALADVLEGRVPRATLRARLRAKRDEVRERRVELEQSFRLLEALVQCQCRGECALVARLVDGPTPASHRSRSTSAPAARDRPIRRAARPRASTGAGS